MIFPAVWQLLSTPFSAGASRCNEVTSQFFA
jgi:hypothetical protein